MKTLLISIAVLFVTSGAMARSERYNDATRVKPVVAESARSSDTYNLRLSGIGLLVGVFNANLDIAVTPEWTVGPVLSYAKYGYTANSGNTYDVTGSSFGIRGNWFKNGVYTDGLYVGPEISYASATVTSKNSGSGFSGNASGSRIVALVGYGWFWQNFNQMLGAGASASLGTTKVQVTDSNGNVSDVSTTGSGFAVEYSLGWNF